MLPERHHVTLGENPWPRPVLEPGTVIVLDAVAEPLVYHFLPHPDICSDVENHAVAAAPADETRLSPYDRVDPSGIDDHAPARRACSVCHESKRSRLIESRRIPCDGISWKTVVLSSRIW